MPAETRVDPEENTELDLFRKFLDSIPGSAFIMGANGRLKGWNQYTRDVIFGKQEHEMSESDAFAIIHPDNLAEVRAKFLRILNLGTEEIAETRATLQGKKEYAWRMIHGRKIVIDGEPCVLAIGMDISERKNAEKKLYESQTRLKLALEAAHAGIWEADLNTGDNIWSDEIWALYGLERKGEKPSTELWKRSVHPDDREATIFGVEQAVRQMIEIHIEYRVIHPDDTVHWLLISGMPLRDDTGKISRYIGTVIDITKFKEIEHERTKLLESKKGLYFSLKKSRIGWWELNLQDNSVSRSLEHERIFGYESLQPTWTYETFLDHVIAEDRAEVDQKYRESKAKLSDWNIECRIRRADGEIRWIWAVAGYQLDKTGRPCRLSGLIRDITERKKAEEDRIMLQSQLQQVQKMELIGRFAGGIAHDFNNVLTTILGNTELLLGKIDDTHPFFENLENIRRTINLSTDLIRQLLAFARKQTVKPAVIELDKAAVNLHPLIKRLIGEQILFVWRLRSNHAEVSIDPSQFDQIMTNLCINARDAIGESGTITIETSVIHVGKMDCSPGELCLIPGDYVKLSVTDSGSGIESKTLPHIFEPYFTTKEPGKGTGLGLSMIQEIVKHYFGHIDCRTIPGKGTTFNIYLPIYKDTDSMEKKTIPEPPIGYAGKTILLVEDESSILELLRTVLEDKGYTVYTAPDAEEAAGIANKYGNAISLLITDIVLPKMSGIELSKELKGNNPELKLLFMSGYAADTTGFDKSVESGLNFLQKPFTLKAFTATVQNLLNPVKTESEQP